LPSTMTTISNRARGPDLLVRHWPAGRNAFASLLIVHGLGEHSGRYEHVGARLAADGVHVHAYDQRGFGGSGGRRAYVDTWEDIFDDVEERLAAARTAAPDLPVALYGHSLGGLIALSYVLLDRPKPDFLVLSAPGLEDRLPTWKRQLARALDRVAPRLLVNNGIPEDALAADPRPDFVYTEDPLMENRTTVRFGALGFANQASARHTIEALEHLPLPTLVIHGADDPIVPITASALLERFPEVRRIVYPGLRHEVHNETDSRALEDILAWLREQARARSERVAGEAAAGSSTVSSTVAVLESSSN
jgi:alpha-beta hydrolase superfamily lysophospholipase